MRPTPGSRRSTIPGRSVPVLLLGLLLAFAAALGGAAVPVAAYDEGTIVSLANQARAANGLGGLVHNPSLDAVAAGWAQQMASSGTLGHNPSVGQQIPGGWTSWGENVAQGYASGGAVHDGWMNSSGHRANILGSFTDIGVSLISAGGTTWAVQVFASYPGSGLAAPAPPPPAPAPAAPAPAAPAAPAPAAPAPAESAPAASAPAEPVPAASPDAGTETASPSPSPTRSAPSAATPPATASETAPLAAGERVSLTTPAVIVPWGIAFGAGVLAVCALLVLPRLRRPRRR